MGGAQSDADCEKTAKGIGDCRPCSSCCLDRTRRSWQRERSSPPPCFSSGPSSRVSDVIVREKYRASGKAYCDSGWMDMTGQTHDTTHRWAIRPSLSVMVAIRGQKLTCVLTSDDSSVAEKEGRKVGWVGRGGRAAGCGRPQVDGVVERESGTDQNTDTGAWCCGGWMWTVRCAPRAEDCSDGSHRVTLVVILIRDARGRDAARRLAENG